jgi:hypothetical protein
MKFIRLYAFGGCCSGLHDDVLKGSDAIKLGHKNFNGGHYFKVFSHLLSQMSLLAYITVIINVFASYKVLISSM